MRPRTVLLCAVLLLVSGLVYLLLRSGDEPEELQGPDPVPERSERPRPTAATPPPSPEEQVTGSEGKAPGAGRVVLEAGWGSGADQLGRTGGRESNPEGPMSLTVDGQGNLLLLDQVNRRIQRFGADGSALGGMALKTATAQDLLVDEKGRTMVLDRLNKEPGVDLYDHDGRPLGRLPALAGDIKQGGAITGLFADGDSVYVEDQNDDLVKVGGAGGKATTGPQTLPGRPTRDGKLLIKAGIIDRASGKLYVQAHGRDRTLAWETPVTLTAPPLHILMLDSDNAGQIYLGVEVGREDPVTFAMVDLATVVVRLGSDGKLTGTLTLPPTTEDPTESFRPLVVGPNGTIYHMVMGPGGVRVTAYRL